MIVFVTWLWGDKYSLADVYKLFGGVRRHMRSPFRFFLMTERERSLPHLVHGIERHAIKDPDLLKHRGCLVRLRMFEQGWQRNRGLQPGDRLVSLDLDNVVTGDLESLFSNDLSFAILKGANAVNPCPYTGAIFMVKAFTHSDVWEDFSLDAVQKTRHHEFPDDQGWLAHKIPQAGAWQVGSSTGIYAFCKPGWPGWPNKFCAKDLPADARIVCFIGWRKPSKFAMKLEWIRRNWRYP